MDRKRDNRPVRMLSRNFILVDLIEELNQQKSLINFLKLNPEERRENALKTVRRCSEDVEEASERANDAIDEIREQTEQVKANIERTFANLRRALKSKEEELISQVSEEADTIIDVVQELQLNAEQRHEEALEALETVTAKLPKDIQQSDMFFNLEKEKHRLPYFPIQFKSNHETALKPINTFGRIQFNGEQVTK